MVPTERNTRVKYQNSSNHCCSKVISKVKVLERRTEWQTGQKQTKTTLPLPVRGFKFWPIHSTHGHWAVRALFFFYLYSAFMDIDQLGFFSVPHLLRHGSSVYIIIISEDPWHSHLLSSDWSWSCHYLFLRLRSVAASNTRHSACEANTHEDNRLRYIGGTMLKI